MIYKIEENSVGKRIDTVIPLLCTSVSRSYSTSLIEDGNILVNGKTCKASYKVKLGDEISVSLPIITSDLVAEDIPVSVIYEDDNIMIVDKPKGMVVHPGNGNNHATLVNALMYSHKGKLSDINGVVRPGIVHRIDKDTSGILVVAKADQAHKKLSETFKTHSITRKYIALVNGIVNKDKLKLNLPIGRDEKNRIKFAVTSKNSKSAITNVTILKRYYKSNCTLIEAMLETGRTHQIRVHMSYIGHALIGDNVYSNGKNDFGIEGQMLHAQLLGFNHPITGKYMEFFSPLPKEFEEILHILDKKEGSGKD